MRPSLLAKLTVLLAASLVTLQLNAAEPIIGTDIQAALDTAYSRYKGLREGANADYIPALANGGRNPVCAQKAIADISDALGGNPYEVQPEEQTGTFTLCERTVGCDQYLSGTNLKG